MVESVFSLSFRSDKVAGLFGVVPAVFKCSFSAVLVFFEGLAKALLFVLSWVEWDGNSSVCRRY